MSTPGHTFSGQLFWVSLAHAVLIGLIFGAAFIRGCEGPPDMMASVELIVPDFPGDDVSPDKPPQLEPEVAQPDTAPPDQGTFVEPVTKKKEPKAKPDEIKKPDVKKVSPQKNKVEVSKTLVKRPTKGGSKTKLSAEEIQRLLDRGAKIGKPTLSDDQIRSLVDSTTKYGTGTPMTQEMLYLELVRQALYKAWDQPTEIGIAGLVTRVELSMDPDGSISGNRMTGGSGNGVMDESVMRAVKSVRRIPRLPAEFLRSHRRIVVAFELTGSG